MKRPFLPASANLLHGAWSAAKLRRLLAAAPRRSLLPPLDSAPWRRVAANPLVRRLARPLRERAEEEWKRPLPPLSEMLYADFHRSGRRLAFERVYFDRRRRLARAAASLLLCDVDDPWRDRLVQSVAAKLSSVFEEVSWALPAHVASVSGQDPRQIDLFAAETANLMAEMLDLFSSVLSASLIGRIRHRLRRDIFEGYLARRRELWWSRGANNWNAVCHQGVIGAALSQEDDVDLLARLLMAARRGLPRFLDGYGADGGTSEGPGYWEYGFGWFAALNEQLEARTAGRLSLFAGDPHVERIACFGPRFSLFGGCLVNFSDGPAEHRLSPFLLSYLGDRLDEPECRTLAGGHYRALAKAGIPSDAPRCDLFHLVRLFLRCPAALPPRREILPADRFFPDLGVLVAHGVDGRGRRWDFAAKAGHNAEHHNHNDCGSYLLNIDGHRFAAEIGSPEYVKDFFGPRRYEFLAARTLGHSLPLINGCEQREGRAAAARVLHRRSDAREALFRVDATRCYPPEAGCRKFVRSLRFEKRQGRLTVEDALVLRRPGSVEGAFISVHPISLRGAQAVIRAGSLRLALSPLPGTRLDRVESLPYRDRFGGEACVHRLVFVPVRSGLVFQIGIRAELK